MEGRFGNIHCMCITRPLLKSSKKFVKVILKAGSIKLMKAVANFSNKRS